MSTLYLVATPIGNLSDLSPRAREVLSTVDFIAAEDTRVTQKLLNACELPKKPMISYYEHNRRARGEVVLEKLLAGETCALVTDAGTPAVSDPGEDLVALCAEHDVPVIPIPGCCAAVCALAASGLPTGRWCFEASCRSTKKARREHLDTLQGEKRTMIFYEAPHKLCATLRDLRDAFGGDRRLSLSRELTKLHEQTLRMTLDEAVAYFDATRRAASSCSSSRVRRTSRRPSRTRPNVLPLPLRQSAAAWSRARPRRTRSRQFPPKPA